MILLVAALEQETRGLARQIDAEVHLSRPGWRLFQGACHGKSTLLLQTGMGKQRALQAVDAVLRRYNLSAVVCFGFGGGLAGGSCGSLVVSPRHICQNGSTTPPPLAADPALLARARSCFPQLELDARLGDCLSLPTAVTQPAEKRRLGQHTGALVADMESYWVARLAQQHGLPFLGVRAILDPLEQYLPPFDRFQRPDGGLAWKTILAYTWQHFNELPCLPALARQASQARASLTRFLSAYLACSTED